ncbi:MAG: DNA polymerase III subunit delta [Deltaproteobacteria bacterium]|nr:DNA polymerase III subunit delta [Deltaproteobacteria bacterium]
MLYILNGDDDFSLTRALDEIKKGLGDPSLLSTNTTLLEGQKVTPDQLRMVVETVPFLAENRLVIVQGLLGRFESQNKPRRSKKSSPANGRQGDAKSFIAAMANLPDSTILVLTDGRIKNANPLLKLLSGAKVMSFPLLRGDILRQWIQKEAAAQGADMSPPALDLLARLVGGNLWIMSSEINKLALFASGRRVEEEDIKAVVSSAQEANVFAMVDAILDFKVGVAETLLEQLLQQGASPAYLLVMLSRQVRLVVRAKELRRQRKPDMEIQSRLGLKSEFPFRKTMEQAQRYPMERLKQVYKRLLQADLSIKTGRFDGGLALNLLIADLCPQPA